MMYPGRFTIMKKLHFLSVKLHQWNKDHFVVQEHRLRRIESDIADIERKQEAGDLSDLERNTLEGLIRDQWQCTKHLESIWRQKSRQSWCHLGNRNTQFFQVIANFHRAKNQILQIHHNDICHDTLASIKDAAVDYYSILFQPPDTTRAHLGPMGFKRLSEESASWLESPVTIEEIKDSVWSCDGDKSPGPDDFNFKFYRLAWEFIANDLMDLISEFFGTGVLPKGVNRAFISLVPKKTEPMEFKEFQPISMILLSPEDKLLMVS